MNSKQHMISLGHRVVLIKEAGLLSLKKTRCGPLNAAY